MWYKLTWMYIWQQKIRPNEWQPWTNTIAYYPFKWDVENKIDWAIAIMWSGSSIWSDYAIVNRSIITCPIASTFDATSAFTFSIWTNYYQNWYNPRIVRDDSSNPFCLTIEWTQTSNPLAVILNWSPDEYANYVGKINGLNTWNNIIVAYPWSWTNVYVYVNWVKYIYPNWFQFQRSSNNLVLGFDSYPDYAYFYLSEMIIETKQRTDKNALDYYNQTKWNYWIS